MNTKDQRAVVRTEMVGHLGLICLNNPPVNALGAVMRKELLSAVQEFETTDAVRAIAIFAAGRGFSAGADIKELGNTKVDPQLPQVLSAIENCAKPVYSILHGMALGGGLELALATHVRIAIPPAQLALPEVTIGLIPGAGGTQRLPRLIGSKAAIDLITTGRRIDADDALSLGLIDHIAQGDPRDVALDYGAEILRGSLNVRKSSALAAPDDQEEIDRARAELSAKRPMIQAPLRALEAIEATKLEFAQGMTRERELFLDCLNSTQRAGLVHAFQAERAASTAAHSKHEPRELNKIGVIGGGTMGVGIATTLILSGFETILVENDPDRANDAAKKVGQNLDGAVKRGKLTQVARHSVNFQTASELSSLSKADLVIEAIFEDMAAKQALFGQLDGLCKSGAILASNTSYLDLNKIASATSRPQDVIGLHFFSPAHIMRLLEIVVADKTADDVTTTAFALAKRLKKVAVRAGVCDGFIGNRILAKYRKAAEFLVLDGASFEQVDQALEDFGFAMGPFRVSDLAGLDIAWARRKQSAKTRDKNERYSHVADKLCEAGYFGRKSNQGYYDYRDPRPMPNQNALEIIAQERTKAGIIPRTFRDDEITARIMSAIISEAALVLEDGIAQRPIDIDATFLFGYGFPRHLGGPMHYADQVGLQKIVGDLEAFAKDDPQFWKTPALLAELAAHHKSFAELNDT